MATAAKSAGMAFGILTTKHHDGFCLWPTEQTSYNVMNSSYKRDVVKQYVDAFGYLPREDKDSSGAYVTTGDITSYEIHTSTDGRTFTQVTAGAWAADKAVKQARFGAVGARYVRLVAVDAVGGSIAVASEINCGGIAAKPTSSLTTPVQTPVLPGGDNSLSLTPVLAALDNGGMRLENSPANVGYWTSANENATWRVRFGVPGAYTVTATVAAAAASRLVLDARDRRRDPHGPQHRLLDDLHDGQHHDHRARIGLAPRHPAPGQVSSPGSRSTSEASPSRRAPTAHCP
ncbi:alpha-L-fucosidase [Streptomyces sp. NPDC002845]